MSANQYLERIKPYGAVNDALAQAQWAEKKWVWIVDKEEGFIAGHIVEENGDTVKVSLLNDTV
jgi:myosin protein heavy chain